MPGLLIAQLQRQGQGGGVAAAAGRARQHQQAPGQRRVGCIQPGRRDEHPLYHLQFLGADDKFVQIELDLGRQRAAGQRQAFSVNSRAGFLPADADQVRQLLGRDADRDVVHCARFVVHAHHARIASHVDARAGARQRWRWCGQRRLAPGAKEGVIGVFILAGRARSHQELLSEAFRRGSLANDSLIQETGCRKEG